MRNFDNPAVLLSEDGLVNAAMLTQERPESLLQNPQTTNSTFDE